MHGTIRTQYHGDVNIVKPESKEFYLKCVDLVQESNGDYYEIWQHANGYKAAIPCDPEDDSRQ